MEDIWKRAKGLAEEAVRRSQTLTSSVNVSDLVTKTTKKSIELAAEASKKADQIKTAALNQIQIQQIKSLSLSNIIPAQLSSLGNSSASSSASASYSESELRAFGVIDDQRENSEKREGEE